MKKILINKKSFDIRLDKFLVKEFFSYGLSRGEIIRNIKTGNILVNGKKVKPSYTLQQGDTVSYKLSTTNHKLVPNPNLKIKTIYKDENIIVIDKLAGLQIHPDHKEKKNTLVNWLVAKFPEIQAVIDTSYIRSIYDVYTTNPELRSGIVHRLDKNTSGVMVIARNLKSFEALKKLFKEHKVEKKYTALVYGKLEEKSGVIKKPIARAANYKKQVIAGRKTKTKIREAVTEYKILKEYSNHSLLEITPKTGRMHQIRIHLYSIGHPVAGDKIYKSKEFKKYGALFKRQLLHAKSLKFKLFGKTYSFHSALPDDFNKAIKNID